MIANVNMSLRSLPAYLGMAALVLLTTQPLFAATCTSAGSGNWNAGATWSGCGTPANDDDVIIQNGHTVTLNVNTNRLDTLTINAGGTLRGDGTNKILLVGRGGATDVTNNGSIEFSGAFLAAIRLDRASRWAGSSSSVWNLSTIDLNGRALDFAAGTSFTLNLSGAGNPFQNETGGLNRTTGGGGGSPANPDITFNYNGTSAQTLSSATITAKKVTSPAVIYGILKINNPAGVSLALDLDDTNLLSNVDVETGILNDAGFSITGSGGTFLVRNGARFNITNVNGMVTGFGTKTFQPTSTVDYAHSGNQPVSLETYGNLRLSGSGTKTPPAGTNTVAGNFTVEAGVTYAGSTNNTGVDIGGNLSNSGTFNVGTGVYRFNGSGVQNLSGVTSFTNLAIANTGTGAGAGLTLSANTTVTTATAGTLTFTSGVINTGSFRLIVARNCTAAISRTSGHVAGNLQLRFPTGANVACTFHVGDPMASGRYAPATTTFASVTTAGDAVGSTTAGDHPDIGNSSIDSLKSVNRFWTLTNTSVGFTTYNVALGYVAADNDGSATPANYVLALGAGCSGAETGCTWSEQTVSGTPSNVAITAAGMSGFGRLIVGERRAQLNNFLIDIGGGTASVCSPRTITITARRADNTVLTGYVGTVSISTSTNHGDWTRSPTGNLVNGTADDGAAMYTFTGAGGGNDNGQVVLALSNTHADDLTISVTDTAASVTSTSATLSFRENAFEITGNAIVVAGRNETYSVRMVRRDPGTGVCGTATDYTGVRGLRAWISRAAGVNGDPGGAAPQIGALSLPNALPGANNLALTFASGVSSFALSTTDVGKYVVNLRDTPGDPGDFTNTAIDGSSATLTVRPFGFSMTVQKGGTPNPGGTATAGAKFVAAGDTFEATVTARRWQSGDDVNNDGVPDSGADLTDNPITPSYAFATALSTTSAITPASGVTGSLGGTVSIPAGTFSGGAATVADLTYSEVGSVVLQANATDYLGTVGANLTGLSAIVGRFFPNHFADISAPSAVNAACVTGGFTYMGQSGVDIAFALEARNTAGARTQNYRSVGYSTGAVLVVAENNNDGVDRSSRLSSLPSGTWVAGQYTISSSSILFSRNAAPDGPFDALDLGVEVVDVDGPVLANRNLRPNTTGDCAAANNCTALRIGTPTGVRFGRLRMENAAGTTRLDLPLRIQAQYFDGTSFRLNADDSCTSFPAASITMDFAGGSNLLACETAIAPAGTVTLASGLAAGLRLRAPGTGNDGRVDLRLNLAAAAGNVCTSLGGAPAAAVSANRAYLQGNWTGGAYDQDPRARATFGIYRNANEFIYFQENF